MHLKIFDNIRFVLYWMRQVKAPQFPMQMVLGQGSRDPSTKTSQSSNKNWNIKYSEEIVKVWTRKIQGHNTHWHHGVTDICFSCIHPYSNESIFALLPTKVFLIKTKNQRLFLKPFLKLVFAILTIMIKAICSLNHYGQH